MSKFVITTPPGELKPCPLCGGAAQAYELVYEHHIDSHVACKNPDCGCALHMESPQRAREAWNSRHSSPSDVAHDERIGVWAHEILWAIAEYTDDMNGGDVVNAHRAVRDELRGIVETVADGHPEIAAQLSAAIAERDAARGEAAALRCELDTAQREAREWRQQADPLDEIIERKTLEIETAGYAHWETAKLDSADELRSALNDILSVAGDAYNGREDAEGAIVTISGLCLNALGLDVVADQPGSSALSTARLSAAVSLPKLGER